jgi:hypothetical protein
MLAAREAQACEPVAEVSPTVQVAWVSRVAAGADNNTWLQVVDLGALRGLVTRANRDSAAVLRGLGLLSRSAKAHGNWKVTVFEVESTALCRPMDAEPGTVVAGLPVCDDPQQRAGTATRAASYSGCGYLTDLGAGVRGLDVYRVRWADAVRKGYCLLPWERLLQES